MLVPFLAGIVFFCGFAVLLDAANRIDLPIVESAHQLHDYERQVSRAALHERTRDYLTAAVFHEAASRRAAAVARRSSEPGVWLARALGHRESAARLRSLHVSSTIPMLSGSSVNSKGW